jgi:hypothetical protein
MADLENQDKYNKVFSLFMGVLFAIVIYSSINKNPVIIVEKLE